jgi:hypothetical protein
MQSGSVAAPQEPAKPKKVAIAPEKIRAVLEKRQRRSASKQASKQT